MESIISTTFSNRGLVSIMTSMLHYFKIHHRRRHRKRKVHRETNDEGQLWAHLPPTSYTWKSTCRRSILAGGETNSLLQIFSKSASEWWMPFLSLWARILPFQLCYIATLMKSTTA